MNDTFERRDSGILAPKQNILGFGRYHAQHIRDGEVIDEFEFDNVVTSEGLNSMLGVHLHGDTQITTWYLGLFEGNYTPVTSDTAANFATAATETTAYTAATRQTWTSAAPATQSITNSANKAAFTFNADNKTIYGAFLTSGSAKNGATGVLFSAARFATPKVVNTNDQLLLTYSFTAASA